VRCGRVHLDAAGRYYVISIQSALTLLETGILFVDYKDFALATDDLAIFRATLDA